MEVVVCIATGPSLTQEDVDYCRDKATVFAVNDSYKIAPWADVLYAADGTWWDHHKGVADFKGQRWTVNSQTAQKYGFNYIAGKSQITWSENKDFIATGGNSGFQALNLAAIQGAKKVILLGYDYGYDPKTQERHFFGEHPAPLNRGSDYRIWIEHIYKAASLIKIPVINCSRKTAIKCFPQMTIQEALC